MRLEELEALAKRAGVDPTFGGLAYRLNTLHYPDTAVAAMLAQQRRETLEEAAGLARNWCLVPPDGGSPTEEEAVLCDTLSRHLYALAAREEGKAE